MVAISLQFTLCVQLGSSLVRARDAGDYGGKPGVGSKLGERLLWG